jgi:hypothetical protein
MWIANYESHISRWSIRETESGAVLPFTFPGEWKDRATATANSLNSGESFTRQDAARSSGDFFVEGEA